jgi:hypothetical protein
MATQQRPSSEDIIRQDVQRTGGDFDQMYAILEKGIESGRMRIFRFNNTLAIYTILEKGIAEVHFATVDQIPALIEAFKNFYHSFKVCGFKSLYSVVEDPQVIRLLQMAKIPFHAEKTRHGLQISVEVK